LTHRIQECPLACVIGKTEKTSARASVVQFSHQVETFESLSDSDFNSSVSRGVSMPNIAVRRAAVERKLNSVIDLGVLSNKSSSWCNFVTKSL